MLVLDVLHVLLCYMMQSRDSELMQTCVCHRYTVVGASHVLACIHGPMGFHWYEADAYTVCVRDPVSRGSPSAKGSRYVIDYKLICISGQSCLFVRVSVSCYVIGIAWLYLCLYDWY